MKEVSHGSRSRSPVYQGKQRVAGLWVRKKADGSIGLRVAEADRRADAPRRPQGHRDEDRGDQRPQKLGVGVEEGEVKVGDRSLTITKLAADFLAREEGILGTRESVAPSPCTGRGWKRTSCPRSAR